MVPRTISVTRIPKGMAMLPFNLPDTIKDVATLEEVLSQPTPELVEAAKKLEGDVTILGVGGKMGPTLAKLLRNCMNEAGNKAKVIGVDRFPDNAVRDKLAQAGVETVNCELLDQAQMDSLAVTPYVIYMVGMKFGSTGKEALTWAINSYLPGMVVKHFAGSRIAALSSGNVYKFAPVSSGGSRESDPVEPIGEYAQSTLGRERIFTYWSEATNTPVTLIRLNYAVELRYGVLLDVANQVYNGETVDVTMGNLNCMWQGDANAAIIQALQLAEAPPFVMNITGPEILSVRKVADEFGKLFGKEPKFEGEEAPTALLNNAAAHFKRFGFPRVSAGRAIQWIAEWVKAGGATLDKPTHFQTRDGKF